MKLNLDKVPSSLDDAVATLRESLTPDDIKSIKVEGFNPSILHFSMGMMLRNEWDLWDVKSRLVNWFRDTYGVDHADDISSIILDTLYRDVTGQPRQAKQLAERYIAHWEKQKKKRRKI